MKTRLKYICTNCGYESLRWLGKCPECENWNTFTEEIVEEKKRKPKTFKGNIALNKISDISANEDERILTGINEFDRVLGGGLMPGSVVLLGGDPGIGKSTLAMQAASGIQQKVLYVTGEESAKQIKIRATRLKITSDNFYILAETDLNIILTAVINLSPDVLVIGVNLTILPVQLHK